MSLGSEKFTNQAQFWLSNESKLNLDLYCKLIPIVVRIKLICFVQSVLLTIQVHRIIKFHLFFCFLNLFGATKSHLNVSCVYSTFYFTLFGLISMLCICPQIVCHVFIAGFSLDKGNKCFTNTSGCFKIQDLQISYKLDTKLDSTTPALSSGFR